MHINERGSVQLEEGETFVNERQDDDNIWRIATFTLVNGAEVTLKRHFSTIGPCVYRPDGTKINTDYDRAQNCVREFSPADYEAAYQANMASFRET